MSKPVISFLDLEMSNETKIVVAENQVKKLAAMTVTNLKLYRDTKKVLAELYRRRDESR